MTSTLFLSPHPDDLVYSAFSALTEHSRGGTGVTFFNVSRFTKWGLLPKYFVTPMRTLEERIILTRLRVRSSFLWMEDSSSRSCPISMQKIASKLNQFSGTFEYIFCPLGISGHPDHLAVRRVAIDYWRLKCDGKPSICFYEDLPYAAKVKEIEVEVERCLGELSRSCDDLSICYRPMSTDQFNRKVVFSRLYLTQNDQSKLLKKHAQVIGKQCDRAYAERYVCSH
ncbi:MAG TPA: PIG-L family deacetylase [Nitrososphaerales archaeon]|nr:PIG-L family deacetylase [Nitrososphaerales archaeon]